MTAQLPRPRTASEIAGGTHRAVPGQSAVTAQLYTALRLAEEVGVAYHGNRPRSEYSTLLGRIRAYDAALVAYGVLEAAIDALYAENTRLRRALAGASLAEAVRLDEAS